MNYDSGCSNIPRECCEPADAMPYKFTEDCCADNVTRRVFDCGRDKQVIRHQHIVKHHHDIINEYDVIHEHNINHYDVVRQCEDVKHHDHTTHTPDYCCESNRPPRINRRHRRCCW